MKRKIRGFPKGGYVWHRFEFRRHFFQVSSYDPIERWKEKQSSAAPPCNYMQQSSVLAFLTTLTAMGRMWSIRMSDHNLPSGIRVDNKRSIPLLQHGLQFRSSHHGSCLFSCFVSGHEESRSEISIDFVINVADAGGKRRRRSGSHECCGCWSGCRDDGVVEEGLMSHCFRLRPVIVL